MTGRPKHGTKPCPSATAAWAPWSSAGSRRERIQFNEETLWTGGPHDYAHPGAVEYLGKIRELLFAGKPREAEQLAMENFMSVPLGQMAFQPFGDLEIELAGHAVFTDYERSLDSAGPSAWSATR